MSAIGLIVFGLSCFWLSRKRPDRPVPTVLVVPVTVRVQLPQPTPEQIDFAAWADELRAND